MNHWIHCHFRDCPPPQNTLMWRSCSTFKKYATLVVVRATGENGVHHGSVRL